MSTTSLVWAVAPAVVHCSGSAFASSGHTCQPVVGVDGAKFVLLASQGVLGAVLRQLRCLSFDHVVPRKQQFQY